MPVLREKIDDKYKWNLEKIYKNNSEFEEELNNILVKMEDISKYQGNILKSSDNLYNLLTDLNIKYNRII